MYAHAPRYRAQADRAGAHGAEHRVTKKGVMGRQARGHSVPGAQIQGSRTGLQCFAADQESLKTAGKARTS